LINDPQSQTRNGKAMFKNYFTTALRHLLRRKGYSFINIAGLTLGLACCLIIFQYVAYEYSFDDFNANATSLYRVIQARVRGGGEPETRALSGYAMGPALAESVPEVVRFARLHPDYSDPIIANAAHPDQAFKEEQVYYADAAFLQMFSYPLVSGEQTKALAEPGTLLLSESTARKYFGAENPMGQMLNVTGWISGAFRVNGIFRDIPANSHLQFQVLLSMVDLLEKSAYSDPEYGWNWQNFNTYVQLRDDANLAAVERKFTDVLMRHRGDDFRRINATAQLHAQPLREIHLNDSVVAPKVVRGSSRTVYFFAIIAVLTLVIALVNYVNLATARALDRGREVGVRKVVGAQRMQLALQFLFESALTNLVAFVFAIMIAEIAKPFVNNLAGAGLTEWAWSNPWLWVASLAMFFTGTLLAGLYPAFVLSSFRPVSVLKEANAGSSSPRFWLRRGLVVLQFTASAGLLAGTVIVYEQLDYMRHMDLGIDLEQILTVPGPRVLSAASGPEASDQAIQRMIHELRQASDIREIATSSALPGQGFDWYSSNLRRATADPSTGVNGALAWIDTSFASLYGLELIAGSGFEGISTNTAKDEPRPVIANETAVKAVGFDTPAEALQQLLTMGGSSFRIVGVFKDFHWSSAHSQREAALFTPTPAGNLLSIKVGTANLPQTIAAVERVYKTLFPGNPFSYSFVDEKFDEQYRNDQRFAALFSVFAVLAIIIACLGLFGLASFSARQRTKEIGIRKVLGATVANVIALLSKEFVKLVLAANLLAWPLAYFAMYKWLQDFAYRINIGWWVFALAGGTALLIALLTVGTQAVKAALANPVEALRYE
jgi:putative ABC transport system permease protein